MSELLLLLLIVLPIGDSIASLFFIRLFWISKQERVPGTEPTFISRLLFGRSWLLALLALKCVVVTIDFSFVGWLAYLRLVGQPVVGAGPIVIVSLAVLGLIPIIFMVAFWRTRKRRHGTPPPFGESD